jgi:hypothetical protein
MLLGGGKGKAQAALSGALQRAAFLRRLWAHLRKLLTGRLPEDKGRLYLANLSLNLLEKMVGVAGFEPTTPSPPD